MNEKKTSELLSVLNSIKNPSKLSHYINDTINDFNSIDLVNYFEDICNKQNIKKSILINNSGINRTYGYQILNGSKRPSRDKIIQLCIGAKLTLEQTQRALTLGGVSNLYPKNSRDSIIIFAINRVSTIIEINELLYEYNFLLFGDDDL